MRRIFCCGDMGAALSQTQNQGPSAGLELVSPPVTTLPRGDRKKKCTTNGLGSLKRRLAGITRNRNRKDDADNLRYFERATANWSTVELQAVHASISQSLIEYEYLIKANKARKKVIYDVPALSERVLVLEGAGWSMPAHGAALYARSRYFRNKMDIYPNPYSIKVDGPLESLTLNEAKLLLNIIYRGTDCPHDNEYNNYEQLDLINVEGTGPMSCGCSPALVSSLLSRAGIEPGSLALARDMKYLLDTGLMSDVLVCAGSNSSSAIKAHTFLLAMRSQYFRRILSRSSLGPTHRVCVDERVLPTKFIHALLYAAYTNQLDMSLVSRTSPCCSTSNSLVWPSASKTNNKLNNNAVLQDVFQLYEIARFVEMECVCALCEDAIVESLKPNTIADVLNWSKHEHASKYVYRQSIQYLSENICTCLSLDTNNCIPIESVCQVLQSDYLQYNEGKLLRTVLKWSQSKELLQHIRTEHLPPSCFGLISDLPSPSLPPSFSLPLAWVAQGQFTRKVRACSLYLQQLTIMLESVHCDESAVARYLASLRRTNNIPDTLYMVSNRSVLPTNDDVSILPPELLQQIKRKALRILAHAEYVPDNTNIVRFVLVRCVRECGLPDECADVVLPLVRTKDICVPDVAMQPNGNTHLLNHYSYESSMSEGCSHPLQLDLGDKNVSCRRNTLHYRENAQTSTWSNATGGSSTMLFQRERPTNERTQTHYATTTRIRPHHVYRTSRTSASSDRSASPHHGI